MNSDWVDFLREMNAAGVRYLLVGAHAVGVHGVPRATRDIDVWVEPSAANAALVVRALARFGAPLAELGVGLSDFESHERVVKIGVPPNRIDLMTSVSGVPDFAGAWTRRKSVTFAGTAVDVIGREDLLQNKQSSGRDKDLLDVRELRKLG